MAGRFRLVVRLALVAACSAPVSAPGEEPLVVRQIAASATDPAIDDVIGVHHVAIGPAAGRIGRLLVFLPGTTGAPQQYATLIERAARLGHHAVGLAYVNQVPVNVLCAGMGASGCHEQVRREILFGTDESDLVEVDSDNGVFHRLDRLLAYLETLAPDEAWSRYRDASGAVRWDRVVVSGHSQGAGHAAFIARLHRVARAVLFSGTEPAPWTQAGDFATPAADFFGFAHLLEPIYPPIQASWDNIGIPGDPTSVDAAPAPYGGSHQLATAREDCTGDPQSKGFHHNCHCVDGWMPAPLPDGTPAFQPVWDHLFAAEPAGVPSIGPAGAALLAALLIVLATLQMRRAGSG
jgi:hypothetical protein